MVRSVPVVNAWLLATCSSPLPLSAAQSLMLT